MVGQLRLKLEPSVRFHRDRLIVSPANAEAVSVLDRWPASAAASGALALIGPAGSGKSHIAHAWAKRVGAAVLGPGDLAEGALGAERRLVLLEDADRAPAGEALFHLLNQAALAGSALLVTGRTAPSLWSAALPDLRSRLNALPVLELAAPDDAILRGMLLKLFADRNIRPPEDLLAYLLRRMERSATAAEALVQALDEASHEGHRPVSRALAIQLLRDETGPPDGL